jgi:hypothetical protein
MNKKMIAIGAGIFSAGLGGGYVLGHLLTVKKVEDWANKEIQSVKDVYAQDASRKEGVFATPQGAAEILIPNDEVPEIDRGAARRVVSRLVSSENYGVTEPASETDDEKSKESLLTVEEKNNLIDYGAYSREPVETSSQIEFPDAETIVQSIWDNSARLGEDVTEEAVPGDPDSFVMQRNPDKPYIISEEMFMTDEKYDDNKMSLLYFEEDGQLVDEREQLIPNVEEVVGERNMTKFGVGTDDRNSVYIRNEKLHSDIEVIRDKRSYSEVVIGVKPERANSSPRKMRDDDDR